MLGCTACEFLTGLMIALLSSLPYSCAEVHWAESVSAWDKMGLHVLTGCVIGLITHEPCTVVAYCHPDRCIGRKASKPREGLLLPMLMSCHAGG